VLSLLVRWLIDNDRDAEGMRVIADLHGGNPEDVEAVAEFQEIKDRVMWEVEVFASQTFYPLTGASARKW
jgi:hypothetical protein